MANRKLGRPTDQRMALLRNQVTNLIWYGRIETTLTRAKEVRSLAERLITVALRQCDNTIELKKETKNDKQQIVVLDEGRIVGRGRHSELMETCPEYQEIAKSQLSQKELGINHTEGGES